MEEVGAVVAVENRALTPDEVGLLAGLIIDEPDHYTALGVDRNASNDEISEAYRLAVQFFHPLKGRRITESDSAMQWKLSSAWARLEKAFSVLSSQNRRKVYDDNLGGQTVESISKLQLPEMVDSDGARENAWPRPYQIQQRETSNLSNPARGRQGAARAGANRRRVERAPLFLPVRVTFDHYWQELSRTLDVSPLGIRFYLSHRIEPGSRLQVELPMPKDLRTHSHDDEIYVATAYVIYVIQDSGGRQVVAEFI
jgi:curved DNA-binding protein CbpA